MLDGGGRSELLCFTTRRSAEIANAAWPLRIAEVAEMAYQARHAALVRLRVANHQVVLGSFVLALCDVGLAPVVVPAADVLGIIHHRAPVNPKFFERLVERVGIDTQDLLPGDLFDGRRPEAGEDMIEHCDVREVPAE